LVITKFAGMQEEIRAEKRRDGIGEMAQAVIFDWFGTLARWDHEAPSNYAAVLDDHGFGIDPVVIGGYLTRWDGVDHHEHSVSREAYLAWTRLRLFGLAEDCGVPASERRAVVEALVESDFGSSMEAYPETLPVLSELRRRNFAVAVCSNWGWDLEPYLEQTGVAPLVDVPVTSARAGYRKPHPAIYEITLTRLGVSAGDAVFVGDSWRPDVLGPISAGMAAVHVCRDVSAALPELVDGAHRVATLHHLLTLEPFETRP